MLTQSFNNITKMENKTRLLDMESVIRTNLETTPEHQALRTKEKLPNPLQEIILDQG